jgi:hypothetical protein
VTISSQELYQPFLFSALFIINFLVKANDNVLGGIVVKIGKENVFRQYS